MKNISLVMILVGIILVSGCATDKPAIVKSSAAVAADPCPLPSGYKLDNEIVELAKQALIQCPQKFDQVFAALLEISKHSPHSENAEKIQVMLKDMVKENRISEKYSKNLYQKYFSIRFVLVPDMKVFNISREIESVKSELKKELALKRIGMIECCADRESYRLAEAEFGRIIELMENIALNEDYLRAGKG